MDLGGRLADWVRARIVQFLVAGTRHGRAGGGFDGAGRRYGDASTGRNVLPGAVSVRVDSHDRVCYF